MRIATTFSFIALLVLPINQVFAVNSSTSYNSELEAVRAATDSYLSRSLRENREYMGTIFKSGERFGYTVSAGNIGAPRINIKVSSTDWDNVVAFWHTHFDESPSNQYFSDTDTRTAKKFGKPFYLADYTGYLKVFRSGDKLMPVLQAERVGLPLARGFAEGQIVLDNHNRIVKNCTGDSTRPLI